MTLRAIFKELKTKWWQSSRLFLFSLSYEPEGGISDIEWRAALDSLEHAGAKEVIFLKPNIEINDPRILQLKESMNKKSKTKDINEKFHEIIYDFSGRNFEHNKIKT